MLERVKKLIDSKNVLELKKIIDELNENDLAELLSDLSYDDLAKVFRIIPKDKAVAVFAEFDVVVATNLLRQLSESETVNLIDEMYADDATDILEEMPANIVDKILKNCSDETRKDINKLLKYEEDTAGSIMTVEYVEFKGQTTVKEAVSQLENEITYFETINTCYVVDHKRKLYGSIEATDLLFADENDTIKNVCKTNIIYVSTYTDQEEVANIFHKYNLTVMPVVDSEERLVGIITIDDVLDVLESEATEDIKKMAAIIPVDKPYDKTGVFETFLARIPWLLLLMISATFTGKIIESFESALSKMTILTAFIPMLMDTGGNAGGQSSVSVIRALSLNDIKFKDIFKVMFKEFRVSILCAVTLAICNYFKLLIVDRVSTSVALCVCSTLIVTVILAKLIGCTLPMIAKKLGFDPAVMASPFITTIVDACSLIIYFNFATFILGL